MSQVYTIAKGDTLSAIARNNNTSVQEILKANPNIKDANLIYVGNKLVLPGISSTAAGTASSTGSSSSAGTSAVKTSSQGLSTPQYQFMSTDYASDNQLQQQALDSLMPQYQAEMLALQQKYEQLLSQIAEQKQALDPVYQQRDEQVQQWLTEQNTSLLNDALRRGIGRSSYLTDATARNQELGLRQTAQNAAEKSGKLANFDAQIALHNQQLTQQLELGKNTLAQKTQALIDTLKKQRDEQVLQALQYNNTLAQKQFDDQVALQKLLESQAAAAAKSTATASKTSNSSSTNAPKQVDKQKQAMDIYQSYLSKASNGQMTYQEIVDELVRNKNYHVSRIGTDLYEQLLNEFRQKEYQKYSSQSNIINGSDYLAQMMAQRARQGAMGTGVSLPTVTWR